MQVAEHVDPALLAEITNLLREAEIHDRRRPLSEHKWLDLHATEGGRVAVVFARRVRDGALIGYAQLSGEHEGWGVEAVVKPEHRARGRVLSALLEAALAEVARRDGGPLRYWVSEPSATEDRAAAALEFHPDRELRQLRVPLPLPDAVRTGGPPAGVRPFVVGRDEAAWLTVNNRAFADHPEQGGWSLDDLRRRMAQPWFDPAGLLLCELDGRVAGSCWTKVHRDPAGDLGEIYVIGVDPDFRHRGLGRALTVAGLDHLAAVGVPTGMLYVDAANIPAVALYDSLGFTLDHVDRAWRRDVTPR